jgi:hypothetical protein
VGRLGSRTGAGVDRSPHGRLSQERAGQRSYFRMLEETFVSLFDPCRDVVCHGHKPEATDEPIAIDSCNILCIQESELDVIDALPQLCSLVDTI